MIMIMIYTTWWLPVNGLVVGIIGLLFFKIKINIIIIIWPTRQTGKQAYRH